MQPGSIVQCRNREWVLLPSDNDEVFLLRPLTGASDEVVAVHKRLTDLIGYSFPEERVRLRRFPSDRKRPFQRGRRTSALAGSTADAARRRYAVSLSRPYLDPPSHLPVRAVVDGLRLDPIRMLIADDVGVGKTIEALLIARELLDRGEIKRLCVLCPPYLCDQWQKELSEKFNLDAVLIRSGTVNQLERRIPPGAGSIYSYYPIQVISIDFVKGDRKRDNFLQHCPDFVIVDEAHGAASAADTNSNQQQRHALLKDLAALPDRHLVLLTATPHSGVSEAFCSLLGLLRRRILPATKSASSARRSVSNSPVTLSSALAKTSRKIGRATIAFQRVILPTRRINFRVRTAICFKRLMSFVPNSYAPANRSANANSGCAIGPLLRCFVA